MRARREQRPHRARRAASAAPSRILANTRSNGARARNRCGRKARRRARIRPARRTPLRRAFSRAMRTASGSMSLASTGTRSALAAAIASTPVPVPISRMRRGRRSLQQSVQRQQAPARGAVMAGAEGERRLDLDADPVRRERRAVVRAVHREAAGRDRLQIGEARGDPVLRARPSRTSRRSARHLPRRSGDARRLVGRRLEMDLDIPASVGAFERRDGGFGRVQPLRKARRRGVLPSFSSQTRRATVVFPLLFIGLQSYCGPQLRR